MNDTCSNCRFSRPFDDPGVFVHPVVKSGFWASIIGDPYELESARARYDARAERYQRQVKCMFMPTVTTKDKQSWCAQHKPDWGTV